MSDPLESDSQPPLNLVPESKDPKLLGGVGKESAGDEGFIEGVGGDAPKGLHPDLLQVKRRVSLQSMWVLIAVMLVAIAIVAGAAQMLGGPFQLVKALSAGVLTLLGTIVGYWVLLRPVDSLNFIGLVYFSILLRMGIGLTTVLIMRQIDTPLYGKDWVGYLLAFYGIGLFLDTFLAARSIKSQRLT